MTKNCSALLNFKVAVITILFFTKSTVSLSFMELHTEFIFQMSGYNFSLRFILTSFPAIECDACLDFIFVLQSCKIFTTNRHCYNISFKTKQSNFISGLYFILKHRNERLQTTICKISVVSWVQCTIVSGNIYATLVTF